MKLHDDRVHNFLDACYSAGIKCPERFLIDKMPRVYGFLKGAFPRGILPTDVDGEVEVNGYFLRMEFKFEAALRDGRIPKGQKLAFERLLDTGKFTIFYIGHNDNGDVTCMQQWVRGRSPHLIDPCDNQRLREACENWARKVEAK